MTNTIAIWLGLLIIGFLVLDHYVLHWDVLTVALRLLLTTIEKVAFWR